MIFKVRLSKWILGFYWFILAFLLFIIFIPYLANDMAFPEKRIFVGVFILIVAIFIWILIRAYKMNFIISQGYLKITGVMRNHKIPLSDIVEARRVPIPFGVRLFGASGLGGLYYIPGVGRTWISMGNFSDGVLIKTKSKKNFVITPIDPDRFVEIINKEK